MWDPSTYHPDDKRRYFDAGLSGFLFNEHRDDLVELYNDPPEDPVLKVSGERALEYILRLNDEDLPSWKKLHDSIRFAIHHLFCIERWNDKLGVSPETAPVGRVEPLPGHSKSPLPTDTRVEFVDAPVHPDIGVDFSQYIGEVVKIDGVVRHATSPSGRVRYPNYRCDCGHDTFLYLSNRFGNPHKIQPGECGACELADQWDFSLEQSQVDTFQQLSLQEPPEQARSSEPRSIEVDIYGEGLVDRCEAGERVSIIGIVKGETDGKTNAVDTWIEAISVSSQEGSFEEVELDTRDKAEVERLVARDDTLPLLTRSMSPSLYGRENEKLALLATLVGGKTRWSENGERQRGESHLLFVGDPSTGKSELLNYACDVAPRSIVATGKGTTAAGLTASAVQRDVGGHTEWVLEAGALVLADEGVAAVDELDKANDEDVSALHEAMQHGEVNIHKAGINTTLKTRTTVLAAANPRNGQWDEFKPLADQLAFDPSLISRFDLIFSFIDEADADRDRAIADRQLSARYPADPASDNETTDRQIVSKQLLSKLLAYARDFEPVMSDDAQELLEEFYVGLRSSQTSDSIPVTARKVPAMARLSEAIARLHLSETVTKEHAEIAITLVANSLEDVGIDPDTGELDSAALESGVAHGQQSRLQEAKRILEDSTENGRNSVTRDSAIDALTSVSGMSTESAQNVLEILVERGFLMEPVEDELEITGR